MSKAIRSDAARYLHNSLAKLYASLGPLKILNASPNLKEITMGDKPECGVSYRPSRRGRWRDGNSVLPDQEGFWIKVSAPLTLTPDEESEEESGQSSEYEALVAVK